MKKNTDEGFTLIELLIVIVILGILATVVVFSVRGITDQGQANSCKATGKTLEVAIESYYAQYGTSGGNPTETQLVGARLIRSNAENYVVNVVGGVSTPVGQGKCLNP